MKTLTTIALTTAALLLTACGGSEDPASTTGADTSATNAQRITQTAWLSDADPPYDWLDVGQARMLVEEGEEIKVRGRIGGRVQAMTEGSPVFLLADKGLPHCGEKEHDSCPTPWDYCCETPETINKNLATVQIVDEEGRPVTDDLREAGLSELDDLVIVGIVGPRPTRDVLTIKATSVYRMGDEG